MLLEAAKVPAPKSVNGVAQMPLHGVNMGYTLTEPKAPTRKRVQYYEMLGSRAIWADGWSAVAWHKKDTPWESDAWELYHMDADFSQSNDLAKQHPDKLEALKKQWFAEAKKYNVLPLDDRRYERVADPTRPVAALPKDEYSFYPGTSILHPLAAPQLAGREHTITALVDIPAKGAQGVLACFGGEFGGWSLFIKDGKLHYAHNYLKVQEYLVSSDKAVPPGKHQLSVSFTPTGKSLKPDFFTGDVVLSIDGERVGELKGIRVAGQYSAVTGYGLLIGRNTGTAVSHLYQPPFVFDGGLDRVLIRVK
jgi:arylsulfatase